MNDLPDPIERVLREQQGFLRALAFRYAPVPALADDIVQNVCADLIAKRGRWDLEADPRPLLHSMIRIAACRCWSERSRELPTELRSLAEHVQALAEPVDVPWFSDEEKAALRTCLERLPERSQRLVEAHYRLGVGSMELAERMRISVVAVRQALSRLRGGLRRCIQTTIAGSQDAP